MYLLTALDPIAGLTILTVMFVIFHAIFTGVYVLCAKKIFSLKNMHKSYLLSMILGGGCWMLFICLIFNDIRISFWPLFGMYIIAISLGVVIDHLTTNKM